MTEGRRPRSVAQASLRDRIVLGAIAERFRRHPRLTQIVPNGYAYVGGRGPRRAFLMARAGIKDTVERAGAATVVAFDLVSAFRHLRVETALAVATKNAFSLSCVTALRAYYEGMLANPRFAGIQEGPPTSPILAELAMASLDQSLLEHASAVVRYSDNVVAVFPAEISPADARSFIARAVASYGDATGARIETHPLEIINVTVRGWSRSLHWMGFELTSEACAPARGNVLRTIERAKTALAAGDRERALRVVEGFVNYFSDIADPGPLALAMKEVNNEVSRCAAAPRRPAQEQPAGDAQESISPPVSLPGTVSRDMQPSASEGQDATYGGATRSAGRAGLEDSRAGVGSSHLRSAAGGNRAQG